MAGQPSQATPTATPSRREADGFLGEEHQRGAAGLGRADGDEQCDGHLLGILEPGGQADRCLGHRVRLARRRIDDRVDLEHGVDGESAAAAVLADEFLVGGEVHAGDLVVADVTVQPLDVGSECRAGRCWTAFVIAASAAWSIAPAPGTVRSMTYLFMVVSF